MGGEERCVRDRCSGVVALEGIGGLVEGEVAEDRVGGRVHVEVNVDDLEGHQPAGRREPNGGHPPRNNVTDFDLTFTDDVVHGGQLAVDDEDEAPPRPEGEKLP